MRARTGIAIVVACGAVGALGARADAGFPPFVSGFEAPCSPDANTPPGYIGGGGSGQPQQCEWGASTGAPATASSPVISAAAPATGAQHLRFRHDPGQATGDINLAADLNSRNWAFSPTITPAPPLGVVTLSFRIRITPGAGEAQNAFIIQPQTPTGGQLTTVMTFFPNGTINVGDDNGNCDDGVFLTVPTGDLWIPGEWVSAAICLDVANDRIRYFYDGRLVYSTGAGEGGTGGPLGCGVFAGQRIENVLFRYEGNFDDGAILDIDDVVIEPDACGPPGPPCPADLSGNDEVDFADVLIVIAEWGPCTGTCPADVSGNDVVDFADVLAVFAAWGPCE
ncbi:MAG: hypothetical protein ACYTGP_04200 [Planctomycetota bacterium]|jgi:hypothetical protein